MTGSRKMNRIMTQAKEKCRNLKLTVKPRIQLQIHFLTSTRPRMVEVHYPEVKAERPLDGAKAMLRTSVQPLVGRRREEGGSTCSPVVFSLPMMMLNQ